MGFVKHDYDNIPAEMKALPQWVCYFRTPKLKKDGSPDYNADGTPRMNKLPVNPRTLKGAKSTEPKHWTNFNTALSAVGKRATVGGQTGTIEGVGFVFAAGDTEESVCGVDLDHVINTETGELHPAAAELVADFDSYTELSPSGSGLHIYYKGRCHPDWGRKIKDAFGSGTEFEMYQTERFFTVTGNVCGESRKLKSADDTAERYYRRFSGGRCPQTIRTQTILDETTLTPASNITLDAGSNQCTRQIGSAYMPAGARLPDDMVIEKASRSRKGTSFSALMSGDTSAYGGDQSRADQALCNILAFWCGGNPEQIDRIFRQSGLMRDKWDEKRGATTYGERTITEAVNGCGSFYDPQYRQRQAIKEFTDIVPQESTAIKGITAASTEPLPGKKNKLTNLTYDTVKKHEPDDIGAAELFADMVKDFVCYVAEPKLFRIYDGQRWKDDTPEDLEVGQVLIRFVRAVQALIPSRPEGVPDDWTEKQIAEERINKWYRDMYGSLSHVGKRNHLLSDVKKYLRRSVNDFDKDPYLFNLQNGTFDLVTCSLREHRASDFISKAANATYDPQAKSERFERFVMEITEGSGELAAAMQRALGYSMQGSANEECFFVALGETTRNGKGTLFGAVEDIFGDYGMNISFDTIARSGSKDGSRATPDVARLQGVRFVSCNEPDKGSCFNEALIKQLTGNDPITARPLYGSPVTFKPVFKLFITANSMPAVADSSIFESERLKVIPFKHHFAENEQDKHLKEKFASEAVRSAILNWLIAGYEEYKALGLGITEEMRSITKRFKYDNDYIQQYIDDRLVLLDPTDRRAPFETLKKIRADYNYWCMAIGVKSLGLRLFKEELLKHDVSIIQNHNQAAVRCKIKGEEGCGYLK